MPDLHATGQACMRRAAANLIQITPARRGGWNARELTWITWMDPAAI